MGSKIIVALKRKYHCEHAEAVLRREGYDYPVFELQPDDTTFRQLQRCVQEGAQVIITGDVQAEKIIEKVNIAVSTIHRSKLSFEEAIKKALSYSPRVAIIWREKDMGALHKACEGIEDQIIQFTSPSDDNYDSIFQQIVREKISVAIGPYPINQYAEKYNVRAVNLPYADEDILSAVHIAEHNLQAIEKNLEYIETLNIIQNNISEGIITLYPNGNIQMMNKAAAEILNVNPQSWEGLSIIRTAVNCTELSSLLDFQEKFSNRILQIRNISVALDGAPVFVHDSIRGYLLTLTIIEQLQRNEQAIRAKIARKGFYAHISFNDIIGESSAMISAKDIARKYAAIDSHVLVYGESGTGKEMFVQSIHNASARRNGPFVVINCAALPENLIESELFGYEKGSFTGALSSGKQGLFERGHKGTVFLDEISEMPLHAQSRFLRVLQEHMVTPIGGERVIPVDVRVIAATNKDLYELVEKGQFREDLYYRISVLTLTIPPLRERNNDIELLCRAFIEQKRNALGIPVYDIRQDAIAYLRNLPFRGNIRELSNIIERSMVLCDSDIIGLSDIIQATTHEKPTPQSVPSMITSPETLMQISKIENAIREAGGNKTLAAQSLHISYATLYRKMKKFGIK